MNKILLSSILAIVMITSVQMVYALAGPTPPRDLEATYDFDYTDSGHQFDLVWKVPSDFNGVFVDYIVEWNVGVPPAWTVVDIDADTAQALRHTVIINVPPNEDTISFRVHAISESTDPGEYSTVVQVTIPFVPDPVTIVQLAGENSVTLSWDIPSNNGADIDRYIAEYRETDNTGEWTEFDNSATPTVTTVVITPLEPGQPYDFRVAAHNPKGNSPYSDKVSATPYTTPDAPVLTATAGDGEVVLTWPEPNANGSTITGYLIQSRTGDAEFADLETVTSGTPYTHTSLINEMEYDYQILATNVAGNSEYSETASATPSYARLVAPASLDATIDSAQITLVWPAVSRGDTSADVTGYVIECTTAEGASINETVAAGTLTTVFTDLKNYVEYTCSVAATNAPDTGTSPGTGPGASVVTTATPAPIVVSADYVYSDDGTIKIRFSPRIDVSASSVAIADFTVTDGTNEIDITNISFSQYKVVLTLKKPVTVTNIASIIVTYAPQDDSTIKQGTISLPGFTTAEQIVNLLPGTTLLSAPITIRADYVYSDDGTIKIRFSPRILESVSSAAKEDFTITGAGTTIKVDEVSLTKFKAVLTLSSPVTRDNITGMEVKYTPLDDRIIGLDDETKLPEFTNTIDDRLLGYEAIPGYTPLENAPPAPTTVRADYVYSDDGTIKIRFSPRIDTSASSVDAADFKVLAGTDVVVRITDVSLTKFKAVLTLSSQVTQKNIDTVMVSYTPQDNRKIAVGSAELAAFPAKSITNLLTEPYGDVAVGFILPISGALADLGNEILQSTNLGVTDFNKHLETSGALWKLVTITEDSETTPAVALEKLVGLRAIGLDVVIGPATSANIENVRQYADANNMLLLSCCSSGPSLAIPDDSVFRLVPDDSNEGPVIAKLVQDAGIQVLVPVWRGDTWGDGLQESTSTSFTSGGGQVDAGIRYDPETTLDYDALAATLASKVQTHVEAKGADKVAVLFLGFSEILDFTKAASDYDVLTSVKWFGSGANARDQRLITDETAVAFTNSVEFTIVQFTPTKNTTYDTVRAQLTDTLGREPSTYAYTSYDTAWVIGLAILDTQSTDARTIRAALPSVAATYDGAAGPARLNANGDLDRIDYEILGIRNSEWKLLGQYDPSTDSITLN